MTPPEARWAAAAFIHEYGQTHLLPADHPALIPLVQSAYDAGVQAERARWELLLSLESPEAR